ncbi:MAG: UDP-N-acetylglucosamine 2-epimerase (non-hydrolyzing) [Candidatus Zixiibacteriota bacterium]
MRRYRLVLIVGARPNFMKSAPLLAQLKKYPDKFETVLIHTGQHYDHNLSQLFFEQLKMSQPDVYLGVGSGTHAEQTGSIMVGLEKELIRLRPDLVVVFGDVNSTIAAAIVAAKLCLKLAHVEAGLRSFDNRMPEEINRIVTDRLSDYLFVTEDAGMVNLEAEGVSREKVFYTGNIMIDSLVANLEIAGGSDILGRLSLEPRSYVAMTMHRPSNVDDPEVLGRLMSCIEKISEKLPVVFPCHPRTRSRIEQFGLGAGSTGTGLRLIEPLGYLDFLKLQSEARIVLTDSGGIQEETTYLGIPCITMRENTELLATIDEGTNTLCGTDPECILATVEQILDGRGKKGTIPRLWDGRSSERIVDVLAQKLG